VERPARQIAAAVLRRQDGKVLLLRRSLHHTTNPGKWCFVTGYVEAGETPLRTAVRELGEELRIHAQPIREGRIVIVHTGWGDTLHVYPFLFEVGDIPITLDREHIDYQWIDPADIYGYDFVTQLDEDLMALGLL
jgi:8-oxo-dGTP pyrophosphatase MutT (NUDIX family)